MPQPTDKTDKPIRSFIAIALPESLRTAISNAIRPLRGVGDVRWVPEEQYHLTLKFLGDTLPSDLEEIGRDIEGVAKNRLQFVVELEGLGAFPGRERVQVIWIGITAGTENLIALAGEVDDACARRGKEREGRPFRPHLTVGRVRSSRDLRSLGERIRGLEVGKPGGFVVEDVLLMESHLLPSGARHAVRGRFPLDVGLAKD